MNRRPSTVRQPISSSPRSPQRGETPTDPLLQAVEAKLEASKKLIAESEAALKQTSEKLKHLRETRGTEFSVPDIPVSGVPNILLPAEPLFLEDFDISELSPDSQRRLEAAKETMFRTCKLLQDWSKVRNSLATSGVLGTKKHTLSSEALEYFTRSAELTRRAEATLRHIRGTPSSTNSTLHTSAPQGQQQSAPLSTSLAELFLSINSTPRSSVQSPSSPLSPSLSNDFNKQLRRVQLSFTSSLDGLSVDEHSPPLSRNTSLLLTDPSLSLPQLPRHSGDVK